MQNKVKENKLNWIGGR